MRLSFNKIFFLKTLFMLALAAALCGLSSAQTRTAAAKTTSAAPAKQDVKTTAQQDASAQHGSTNSSTAGEASGRSEETALAAPDSGEKKEEAGKDEDEEAQFKYSKSVLALGSKLGLSKEATYWLAVLLNFAVLAGAIGWFMKKNLPAHFAGRTSTIRKGIDEAKKASAQASAKLAEIEQKLARLGAEIEAMRGEAEQAARAEEERLRAATEEEKNKIIKAAEQEIGATANTARRELRAFAAELAVGLAQKKLSVNEQTDRACLFGKS